MEYEIKLEDFGIKVEGLTKSEEDFQYTSDFCQACLTTRKNGILKDMTQKCYFGGEYEVYSEMLHSCFSIKLQNNDRKNIGNVCLICDTCIDRLRDAANFKSQVENAQQKIKQKLEMLATLASSKVDIKVRSKEALSADNNCDSDNSPTNDDYFMDNIPSMSDDTQKSKESVKAKISKGKKKKGGSKVKKKSNPPEQRLGFSDLPYTLELDQLECRECNEIFETHRLLRLHMPTHFPNFTCEVCGRVFASARQWNVHNIIHADKIFDCRLCPEKQFKTRAKQLLHMKSKHGGEKFKGHRCPQCPERFTSYDQRQKHLREVHNEDLPEFKCNLCDRTFKTPFLRSSHVRNVHLNERKHVCQICNAAFFEKGMLTKHMSKHTGIKDFTCEVCSKAFPRKHTLFRHMKTHTGEKDHACHICNRAFRHKRTLTAHLASHEQGSLKES